MGIFFLLWLCIAAVEDLLYRKSSNFLNVSGFILAVIYSSLNPEAQFIKNSIVDGFLGSLAAFIVLLIFYKVRLIGAGDVKFAAALGMWVGWKLLLPIWALSCGFAVIHGLVVRSNLRCFFASAMKWNDGSQEGKRRFIPYVTYLSIATVIVLMMNK